MAHQVIQGLLNQPLGFTVQRRGGFVQNQNGGLLQNGAGYGNALSLPTGNPLPPFSHHGIVPLGETGDEVMNQGQARGLDDLLQSTILSPVGNIAPHRIIEQEGVLSHDGNLAAQRGQRHFMNVVSIDADPPGDDIEKTRNQGRQTTLSSTTASHQSHDLPPLNIQVDIA